METISKSELARRLNITRGAITHWSKEKLKDALDKLGVTLEEKPKYTKDQILEICKRRSTESDYEIATSLGMKTYEWLALIKSLPVPTEDEILERIRKWREEKKKDEQQSI